MEIGRNEPCPCGSGKKYKKCHLNITNNNISKSDLKEIENKFKSIKECMAPESMKKECSKKIIKAHTISKSRNLKAIAENGHVLTYKVNSIFKLLKNDGNISIEEIGINNASIFKGFCSYHDKELFSCIEDEDMIFSNKQIFMIAYRSICNELHIKKADLKQKKFILDYIRDKVTLDFFTSLKEHMGYYINGIKLAINDLNKVKKIYDQILLEDRDYDKINYYIIKINKTPDVLVSGNWIADKNFDGQKLIDLSDESVNFNSLNVSSIVTEKGGAFVFSWIDSKELVSNNIYNFIRSFNKLDSKLKVNILPKFIFAHFENTYFSPSWWNFLTQEQKKLIEKDIHFIYSNSTYLFHKNLDKNYNNIFNFDILEIKTNLSNI
jgi:hypothetical protein